MQSPRMVADLLLDDAPRPSRDRRRCGRAWPADCPARRSNTAWPRGQAVVVAEQRRCGRPVLLLRRGGRRPGGREVEDPDRARIVAAGRAPCRDRDRPGWSRGCGRSGRSSRARSGASACDDALLVVGHVVEHRSPAGRRGRWPASHAGSPRGRSARRPWRRRGWRPGTSAPAEIRIVVDAVASAACRPGSRAASATRIEAAEHGKGATGEAAAEAAEPALAPAASSSRKSSSLMAARGAPFARLPADGDRGP